MNLDPTTAVDVETPIAPPTRCWTFIDDLGAVIGNYQAPDDSHMEASKLPGTARVVEGAFNPAEHSWDGQAMVEHTPEEMTRALARKGPGWRWDGALRDWVDHRSEQHRAADRRREALVAIAAAEARQPRALREAALGLPGAAARLQAIDDEISRLRALL